MRIVVCSLALLIPASVPAQQPERITLTGREVAIYNLVGRLKVDGGTGDRVVVSVTRRGRDGGRLRLDASNVGGRAALRVLYPEDRIVYPEMSWGGRTSLTISSDGTFNDDYRDRRGADRRRVEVSRSGDGVEAYADLEVSVPRGTTLYLRQGVGETTIDNVDGTLRVSVAASRVRATRVTGSLHLDAGSGGVTVSDLNGTLRLESGSGGATLDNIRGSMLDMDVGSGSVQGRNISVTEMKGDVGSGGVRLSGVRAARVDLEVGSGGSDIELLAAPDDLLVEAGSGGVTLRLPASTSATVDVETGSGTINSDFEMKLTRLERRSLRGTIGAGKGRIRVEAGSGNVRLIRS